MPRENSQPIVIADSFRLELAHAGYRLERQSEKKMTVLKLILKRFVSGLAYQIWSRWLSMVVILLFLALILYFLSSYECPVRRALGFPQSRSENVATAFYAHPWEQDCEAGDTKP